MYSIGILEDNFSLRQSIEDYLHISGKYHLSFSDADYKSIAGKKIEVKPDILLLDIHLNDVNGIDLISNLKVMFPDASIIIITGDQNNSYLLKAIEKGACGFLYKPFSMAELDHAIATINETGSFLEPDVLTRLFSTINTSNSEQGMVADFNLTHRELEILELLKKGHTYNEIAEKLFLSFHTVNHHVKNLYIKANVNSKSELIVKFFKNKTN